MDAIITVDEDQRIVASNAAAETIFRCPASEAIGGPLSRFILPGSRDRHAEHIRAFGLTGVTNQLVLNLLSNAIKFTDAGSVSLRADLAPDGLSC